jgi:hypothetical protein
MKKIAFVAHRANYLKHYGPVIDAALARGWNVEAWLQEEQRGGKAHLRISPEMLHSIWQDRVEILQFQTPDQVVGLAKQRRPDAIISLHPRSYYGFGDGTMFITLQHSVDSFVEATPQELASSDQLCLFTPYWLDYANRFYEMSAIASRAEVEQALHEKIAYTGFAQMDAFAHIDRAEVRSRWGIPAGQPVVVILPVDLAGWPGAWPPFFAAARGRQQWKALAKGGPAFAAKYAGWALNGWNDEALAAAFGEFCARNDAYLIVKGREKDPLRTVWAERANKSFYDLAHYPATIFEAIAISNLCVVFYSTAAQEAAYAGVPSLCVDRPNRDMVKHKLWRTRELGGPYNYPGVVDWTTIPEVIDQFPIKDMRDFSLDQSAREEYLEIYNGAADHKASQRILELVN